jgi:hypothetical protein
MALIAVYINPCLQDDLRGADVNHFADNIAANQAALRDIPQHQTSLASLELTT